MITGIKKNAGLIILGLIGIVILVFSELKGNQKTPTPTLTPAPTASTAQGFTQTNTGYKEPIYTQPELDASGKVNLDSIKVKTAISEKQKLTSSLPIYIEGFKTSVGITTTLNVYTIPEDPDYLIHIEIYGIDYPDETLTQDGNKNATAFVESFNKIKSLLSEKNVDITKIYFIFGAKPYIQSAADSLIRKYGLL